MFAQGRRTTGGRPLTWGSSSCPPVSRCRREHWGASAQSASVDDGSCPQHPNRRPWTSAELATLDPWRDIASGVRRDGGPVTGPPGASATCRVTGTRYPVSVPPTSSPPRPVRWARSTLRATLRVAPAAPSSRSACGGLRFLVPRPVRQLSVGASRAVSSRPDQDPSALRALRCGSSLGPVVPRRRSRPLSRALCRTGRGNGWRNTCSAVPPVPVSAPVPGGSR